MVVKRNKLKKKKSIYPSKSESALVPLWKLAPYLPLLFSPVTKRTLSSWYHWYSDINHTTVYWPFPCLIHWTTKFLNGRDCTYICSQSYRGLMNVCGSEVVSPASLFSPFPLKTFPSKLLADKNRNDARAMMLSWVFQTLTSLAAGFHLLWAWNKAFSSGFTTLRSSNPWLPQHWKVTFKIWLGGTQYLVIRT